MAACCPQISRGCRILEERDRADGAVDRARLAARLLSVLQIVDSAARVDYMRAWRSNLRKWLSAAVLQPLSELLEENQRSVSAAAAG